MHKYTVSNFKHTVWLSKKYVHGSLSLKALIEVINWVGGVSQTHIVLLRGEGAHADPGGVRLHHAVHSAHVRRGDAEAGAHPSHGAVGGGHEGVRP